MTQRTSFPSRTIVLTLALWLAGGLSVRGEIRDVKPDVDLGLARAVVVDDLPTCFTGQIYPLDDSGGVPATDFAQVEKLFQQLDRLLRILAPQAPTVVRLNFYLQADGERAAVEQALVRRYRSAAVMPSVTFISGDLGRAGARVSVDAVIALERGPRRDAVSLSAGSDRMDSDFAVMPAGRRVYLGGRGFRGADPGAAARDSLRRLGYTLRFAGVERSAVVSVRTWLDPISARPAVEREIRNFFQGQRLPPLLFVGYTSYVGLEIDMTAYGGPADARGETVDYLLPPEDRAAPGVGFSRIARINRGPTIYASSLLGGKSFPADAFTQLDQLLQACGSDWRHLAKGIFFATDRTAYQALNAQRYKQFDPKRPPAITQLTVAGVGSQVCGFSLDVIAALAR